MKQDAVSLLLPDREADPCREPTEHVETAASLCSHHLSDKMRVR